MLHIHQLKKTYSNGVQALKGIDLEIPIGMFGLLGPNGAGKSTLMRTLATLQESDSGRIHFGGLDVLRDKAEVRKLLGYLPQEFGVYEDVSAETLLTHLARLKGLTHRGQRKEAVSYLLQKTNLWEARKRKLGTYSGGMKRRFGVAQALLGAPKLVIVDEPTAGLDPEERLRFLDLLSDIGQDVVVILSTHLVDTVEELCPRMAIIDQGRVLTTGAPRDMVAQLQGKIWKKVLEKSALAEHKQRFRVISTRLIAGSPMIRVFHECDPGSDFETAAPNLEDVYFTALSSGETQV